MLQHIAQWNPTTQLWETDQIDLFSGHSEPFSETFPTSGMTLGGRLLPLPMSGHPIGGNEYSSLLRTPQAQVTEAKPGIKLDGRKPSDPQVGLADQVIALMPTPNTLDHVEKRTMHAGGNLTLQGAVGGVNPKDAARHAAAGRKVPLLPSPVAQQSGSTPEEHLARKPGRTQVTDLAIIVENGLME